GRADGYGSWLSADGALHPHKGHCMIIPIALDMCPANRAERVLETIQNAEIWLEPYGPRRSDDKHRIAGGDTVWAFMRWTLVAALFRAGHAGRAAELAGQWARDELAEGLPAPESFPTAITGITGNGYVWTAARAIRALTYGLFGISLRADGFSCKPVLPAGWSYVTLRNFPFRNKTVTIRVERNPNTIARLNGNAKDTPLVLDRELNQHGANELLITIQ
ncbi:MAG: hypothetical protein KAU31_03990, partial [Spirochaetaceae bacterium]|nr:hypothetical protein [Spirochaetaceae bacterium]